MSNRVMLTNKQTRIGIPRTVASRLALVRFLPYYLYLNQNKEDE